MENPLQKSTPSYRMSVEQVLSLYGSSADRGLDEHEARSRLERDGPNDITSVQTRHLLRILLEQFLNPMIILLLAVVGISLFLGEWIDAGIIGLIVLLNGGIGFFQEHRAERAMESIRKMTVPEAWVLRGGQFVKKPAVDLVSGDIVKFEAGDRIPADLRLMDVASLQVDESLLTGESMPVEKEMDILGGDALTPGDQINMAFMGTHVVKGHGRGIVTKTGFSTELGRIARLVVGQRLSDAPLKKRMDALTRTLVLAAFVLCILIFLIGLVRGRPFLEMLLVAVTLGIAAIPEGLPAVITISLSLGSLRLAKHGTLVRRLQAVEALGSITVICSDKTGTLTENRMKVTEFYTEGKVYRDASAKEEKEPKAFFQAIVLCNDAHLEQGKVKGSGDPMEVALLEFAKIHGYLSEEIQEHHPRLDEIPFDSERKRMTTVHEFGDGRKSFMKGAPEVVLTFCSEEAIAGGVRPLTEERRRELLGVQNQMAERGLRILAVAERYLESYQRIEDVEKKMIFMGLLGLMDPARPEAREAIMSCRAAGIRPVMITGDHQVTAMAIGRDLGIFQENNLVLTGRDLKERDKSWLKEKVPQASVFARVSPEDKLIIIQALKEHYEIVAMTGDGVNDAPALKKADIGIAMGRGTDVAKESSSLILVQENFATIVRAIREGRVIYDNIRKFVRYMLTTNFGEIATMLFAMILGLPIPLLPVQILWINLVTDGLPAVALGFEPPEENVMGRPPRSSHENILGRGLWQHTIWVGVLMGLLTAGMTFFILSRDVPLAKVRSMAFTLMVLAQMAHVMAIRSESDHLWKIGLLSNHRLLGAVMITIFLQLLILYWEPMGGLFHVTPLSLSELGICFGMASVIFFAVEGEKAFYRWRKA